jgi:hypothetical protein
MKSGKVTQTIKDIAILFILGFIVYHIVIAKSNVTISADSQKHQITELIVSNKDSIDSVSVWITIGYADTVHWVHSVSGIFGITTGGSQAMIILAPKQIVGYKCPEGLGISGNICFLSPPLNCPNKTTVCEFCLNNYKSGVNDPQETVEISCVSGVSYIASIHLQGGNGVWTANYPGFDTIRHIQNDTIGANSGLPGVYPYGCDDCDSATPQAPSCTIGHNEKPQKHAICNVQRDAKLSGGVMVISYIKAVK